MDEVDVYIANYSLPDCCRAENTRAHVNTIHDGDALPIPGLPAFTHRDLRLSRTAGLKVIEG